MAVSVLDSRIYRNIFGTEDVRQVFSDESFVSLMIQVDAALARAQATCGVVPQAAAKAITQGCAVHRIDFEKLAADTDIVGYPVLPLVEQMTQMVATEHARYIHWGATTQDIMDCAMMLQVKQGLCIVRKQTESLIDALTGLARKHKSTPMPGRTHLQHALPVTFGYKCAVYLSAFQRSLQRLDQLEQRCLLVQFGGAAGTLASLGDDGINVRKALAQELHLRDPSITWHVARDCIAEVVGFLGIVGGSLGKIALDIIVMSSNELGEVSEPFVPHRGASSTMPQKRNPISSEAILAASKLLRSNASLALDAMVSDFERASGPWHLEWSCIPESFVVCCGALYQTTFAMGGLVVNTSAMMTNLTSTHGLIVAEAVMMALAPFIGRQPAHDVVYAACQTSIENGRSLLDVLSADPAVSDKISLQELEKVCNPLNYMGSCEAMVDSVVSGSVKTYRSPVDGVLLNGSKVNGSKYINGFERNSAHKGET